MIISVVGVYEQGVGLKSSITADTAFRKDLPCRGVPTVHYRRRMLAHLSQLLPITGNHFMIWSQEIRNDKPLYLTTHKSGWPPVSRHPAQEPAALSIWSLPSDCRFGLPVSSLMRPGPLSRSDWTNRETMSPLARIGLKQICRRPTDRYKKVGKW